MRSVNVGKDIEVQIDWNMAVEEMKRIAEIVRILEEYAFYVRLGDYDSLPGYWAALQSLFTNIFPVIRKFKLTKEIETLIEKQNINFAVLRNSGLIYNNLNPITLNFVKMATKLHSDLLTLKQDSGYGVPRKKNIAKKTSRRKF